jgi:3-deoxy-D-manno-octulosonic-acid transferase
MSFIYHTIIAFAILVATPIIILRIIFSFNFRSDFLKRIFSYKALDSLADCIWIHAASVGEVRLAKILISKLKEKGESRPIVLSTFTSTGFDQAKKERVENVFRMPPDFLLWINPVLDHLCPAILVLIEAEMWPGLINECKHRKIPVLLANGRITKKSVDRYRRFSFVFKWISENVTFFSMRTQKDADRILGLGVESEKVTVNGNIKFDVLISGNDTSPLEKKESSWVVFGSTRPGDEGPVMEAVTKLYQEHTGLNFIIAPRHLERLSEVKELMLSYGIEFQLHSENLGSKNSRLVLLDQLGELNEYYAKACLAFVGGSFNPRFGGQNIIEPASHALPVVFGAHMNNFEEEACLLVESGGGIQINNPQELYIVLNRLLLDQKKRQVLGKKAWETVIKNRGAVNKTIELITRLAT